MEQAPRRGEKRKIFEAIGITEDEEEYTKEDKASPKITPVVAK